MNDASYWLSHVHHEGPSHNGFSLRSSGCMICVVLDLDTRFDFSNIRLLIVCEQTETLNHLCITNSPDLGRYIYSGWVSKTTFRSRLLNRRSTSYYGQTGAKLSLTSLRPTPVAPICTITFEVTATDTPEDGIVIALRHLPSFQLSSATQLRVVYDQQYRIDTTNSAVTVYLESNHYFSDVPRELRNWAYPVGVPAHTVHVLPRNGIHHPCIPLKSDIIRHIVDLAIGDKPCGWRKALLDYALVCKSWLHVVALYFDRFDGYDQMEADVHVVARCLEKQPEYGALMHTYSYKDYTFTPPNPGFDNNLDSWHSFLTILRYALSVENVSLPHVPEPLVQQLVAGLANLRQVRECYLADNQRTLTISDIQSFIANWKDLSKLQISEWSDRHDVEVPGSYLGCNLENLMLTDGTLSGPQLLRFASPTECNLTDVTLSKVKGFYNRDLFLFLSSSARTIRQLNIFACQIYRSSPDEELALDATIHRLKELELLSVDGTCVSAPTLTEKVRSSRKPTMTSPWAGYSSILITDATESMTMEQVASAVIDMRIVGWSSISIVWKDVVHWDQSLVERVQALAQERGIVVNLWQR